MKILIVGKNSYVGNSFKQWVEERYSRDIKVEVVGTRDNGWEKVSFKGYDTLLHVSGLAHEKETDENKKLYYSINTDLAEAVAIKAKEAGIKHFVFLSSMSVYGLLSGKINLETNENPNTHYGKSKLEAEKKIKALEDSQFQISIVRPPMIYGKHCKGNYQKISKLAKKTFFFPSVKNSRSMIYISNLSEFLAILIIQKKSGTFFPQNKEYVNVTNLVTEISKQYSKKVWTLKFINIFALSSKITVFQKVFGTLVYDQKMSQIGKEYNLFNFPESISQTESEN